MNGAKNPHQKKSFIKKFKHGRASDFFLSRESLPTLYFFSRCSLLVARILNRFWYTRHCFVQCLALFVFYRVAESLPRTTQMLTLMEHHSSFFFRLRRQIGGFFHKKIRLWCRALFFFIALLTSEYKKNWTKKCTLYSR